MVKSKMVVWLTEEGTYEDQFGKEHECVFVLQQHVVELDKVERVKSGYHTEDRPIWDKRRFYKDQMGRTYSSFFSATSYRQSDYVDALFDYDGEGNWKKAEPSSTKTYLTPDGKNKVKPIPTDHEPGYEFYKETQLSNLLR